MDVKYYRLADGRIWNVEKACWLCPVMAASESGTPLPAGEIRDLVSADAVSDEAYLIQTLEFYGLPLGALAPYSPVAIRQVLDRLDETYLTPRTLAGLATGDAYALAQWQEHEEKAAPLRERLAELDEV